MMGLQRRRFSAEFKRDAQDRGVGVADALQRLVTVVLGEPSVRLRFWDGSTLGPDDGPGTICVLSPDALRRIVWAPGELGVARAYVAGEIDLDGDAIALLCVLRPAGRSIRSGFAMPAAVAAARRLQVLGPPLPPPPEEAKLTGWRHSKRRDAQAISHHYDVGNDFYRLVLGPSMTYSCARFTQPGTTLAAAQASKHEVVCRKLGLHERTGQRLLDVGCGWGSMALHAATHHDADVVGITISAEQADLARRRVADAGLSDRVEIRLQDYRDVRGERFDAVSSIGMFEHVGQAKTTEYFSTLRRLLVPTGRLLNHAVSTAGGSKLSKRTFVYRYVFPDAELIDVGEVVLGMQRAGFEVRDVESLREHYALTLRAWVANLQQRWDEAVALVGDARARIWLLYMAGSAVGFDDAGINVHQVLGVVHDYDGRSGMPAVRDGWATRARPPA